MMACSKRLDINHATVEELEGLVGVGRAKAEAIIEARKKNGGFSSVSDLRQVPGFGPGLLELNLGHLTCSGNRRLSSRKCERETRSSSRLQSNTTNDIHMESPSTSSCDVTFAADIVTNPPCANSPVQSTSSDPKHCGPPGANGNEPLAAVQCDTSVCQRRVSDTSVLSTSLSQTDWSQHTHRHNTRQSPCSGEPSSAAGILQRHFPANFELRDSDGEEEEMYSDANNEGDDDDENGEMEVTDEDDSPFRLRSRLPSSVGLDKYMMKRKLEGRMLSPGKKRRGFDKGEVVDLRPRPCSSGIVLSRKPIPSRDNPPPDLEGWITTFQDWGNAERLLALDELMETCDPTQVRHVMAVIQPQFQRDFISLLPKELALYVLTFLGPKDLLRAAQTCRYWRVLAEDNLLWREKCREENIDENTVFETRLRRKSFPGLQRSPWKSLYMRQHKIELNWRTGNIKSPKVLKGHDDHVITCLEFCGHRVVSGSDDNTLKVWSSITGKCLRTLVGHTGGVWSSQMQGNVIISGSTDRTLKVWNAETGQCTHTLYGHTSTVRCMHLYENKVVSGSRDATLRMWNVESGACLHVLMGHVAAVRCVQFDGHRVISGAYDYMVKVWDPEREVCLHTLQGHTNRVYSLQFDGTHIVSGSLDTSIRVWDGESGNCLHTLIGHQSLTSGMELKDNILVSGNADSTVKVWDITTGQCLQTLQGPNKHQSAVTCLQFNKKFVITSSDDGTVKIWDLKTGEFIRNLVSLDSGGSGGVVWRVRTSNTKLVCAVGSRNGTEETKLLVLDFDADQLLDRQVVTKLTL